MDLFNSPISNFLASINLWKVATIILGNMVIDGRLVSHLQSAGESCLTEVSLLLPASVGTSLQDPGRIPTLYNQHIRPLAGMRL